MVIPLIPIILAIVIILYIILKVVGWATPQNDDDGTLRSSQSDKSASQGIPSKDSRRRSKDHRSLISPEFFETDSRHLVVVTDVKTSSRREGEEVVGFGRIGGRNVRIESAKELEKGSVIAVRVVQSHPDNLVVYPWQIFSGDSVKHAYESKVSHPFEKENIRLGDFYRVVIEYLPTDDFPYAHGRIGDLSIMMRIDGDNVEVGETVCVQITDLKPKSAEAQIHSVTFDGGKLSCRHPFESSLLTLGSIYPIVIEEYVGELKSPRYDYLSGRHRYKGTIDNLVIFIDSKENSWTVGDKTDIQLVDFEESTAYARPQNQIHSRFQTPNPVHPYQQHFDRIELGETYKISVNQLHLNDDGTFTPRAKLKGSTVWIRDSGDEVARGSVLPVQIVDFTKHCAHGVISSSEGRDETLN